MSDFKAKMHQNQFRLGLRPIPRWGSLQRSPRPPLDLTGLLLSAGREKGEREERKERGEEERGKGCIMDAPTPLGEGDFRPSDLLILPPQHETPVAAYDDSQYVVQGQRVKGQGHSVRTVSYTHLTLPTIYSV